MDIFSSFGEVASVYLPVDLDHSCRPKGIAFVRYTSRQAAETAVREMNGANLGVGRDLGVSLSQPREYFSQDESYFDFSPKKKGPQQQRGGFNNNSSNYPGQQRRSGYRLDVMANSSDHRGGGGGGGGRGSLGDASDFDADLY